MKLYVLQEGRTSTDKVVFISESLDNVKNILREKYELNESDLEYFLKWKSISDIIRDITIQLVEIETDTFILY